MSQGAYMTVVGFVTQDPIQRATRNGTWVTDLRIGATPRFQDRATSEWRDGETLYFDVSCWRRLGEHVRASLRKGDPVTVKGRVESRTYTGRNGVSRTSYRIVADTVGHDLNRGIANYVRSDRRPAAADDDMAADQGPVIADDAYLDDAGVDDTSIVDAEAMERFGRTLDRLGDADADLAAQALDEDETADADLPSVPSAPY
jgi:single-strand DNA-binding protein